MRLTVLLAGAFCLFSLQSVAAPVEQLAKEFDQHFRQQLKKANVPGAAYAIVKDNQIIKVGAYGVRSVGSKARVDAYTVFRLASVSKTFTGQLASMLVHQGRFQWQDPVTRYVPAFSFKSASQTKALKVEHLVSQSTGVFPNTYDDLIEANQTPKQILPKFRYLNPRCTPGKCYGYQNVMFSLIEPVMEKTTGQSFESLMEQKLFKPLKMPTASVGYSAFLASKNRAMPHIRVKRGWAETKVNPSYYRVNPAAGVNASVMDMSQWLMAQLGQYPAVLSPVMLQDVRQKRVKVANDLGGRTWGQYVSTSHYGLGLRIFNFAGNEVFYHGGWVKGYRTEMAYSKQKGVGLVVLINAETNLVGDLSTYFWSRLLNAKPQTKKKMAALMQPDMLPEAADDPVGSEVAE
ncbi:serine hydrolase domain-containing protein [Rheinheimera sp.]|uniref:serine hydrolase domain-containing protein n=1 Tax=Rheinheimera sp. TaxID=1869214 RepID=UPI00307EB6EC